VTPPFHVGAFVQGPPTSPRVLVRHHELLSAYADGTMHDRSEEREAYLSHFAFGPEMQTYYAANRNSVAGFVGPCWCRWLVLDIDRADLGEALADARKLVQEIERHYHETEGDVPVYFSGGKGFHVLLELAHNPPPSAGFHRIARTLAEAIAARAGVKIDMSIYDLAHIIRLPNTRHPRTGLFKRFVDVEALFLRDVVGILETAKQPAAETMPTIRLPAKQLAADWHEAERLTTAKADARAVVRLEAGTADAKAPRFFLDFLRFGVDGGERHQTLFRSAAWMTEQGAPPSLVAAVLTEPGRDVGLMPKDVERQIACGIEHARRQGAGQSEGGPRA